MSAVQRCRRALEGLLGVPATEGNRVDVLRNGDEIFPAMLAAIERAEHTIDFLTFIYWRGRIGETFAELLADRARAGVRVRVLLDAFGAHEVRGELVDRLADAGAQVAWFRPVRRPLLRVHHRTHRKILVCDGRVAFTGGVGIADQWCGDARNPEEWRDTHFRVQGPAVDGLRAAFVDNWAEIASSTFADDLEHLAEQPSPGASIVQVVRGEDKPGWSDITTLVRVLLQLARERVRITTAYFAPDDTTVRLLCDTAARGVAVELLLPGPHADKRVCQLASERVYEQLLDAGVRVRCFQPSMLHAKLMLVDGVVANVGSANFNYRSLALDEEINLVVFDPAVTAVLEGHYEHDLARSRDLDLTHWETRNVLQRVGEFAIIAFRGHL